MLLGHPLENWRDFFKNRLPHEKIAEFTEFSTVMKFKRIK